MNKRNHLFFFRCFKEEANLLPLKIPDRKYYNLTPEAVFEFTFVATKK